MVFIKRINNLSTAFHTLIYFRWILVSAITILKGGIAGCDYAVLDRAAGGVGAGSKNNARQQLPTSVRDRNVAGTCRLPFVF
jgi:hypothetical protein